MDTTTTIIDSTLSIKRLTDMGYSRPEAALMLDYLLLYHTGEILESLYLDEVFNRAALDDSLDYFEALDDMV